MLAEDAIKSAISNYYTKNPTYKPTNLAGTAAQMPKVEPEVAMAWTGNEENWSKSVEMLVTLAAGYGLDVSK